MVPLDFPLSDPIECWADIGSIRSKPEPTDATLAPVASVGNYDGGTQKPGCAIQYHDKLNEMMRKARSVLNDQSL